MLISNSLTRSVAGMSIALFAGVCGQAMAAPAFVISNTTGNAYADSITLGWQFSTSTSIAVNALGLFDDSQDGLAEGHQIGLWNAAGTLLASTTVGAGVLVPLTNQFRYSSIASVILGPGTYQVGALYSSIADSLVYHGNVTGFAAAPEVSFIGRAFSAGNTLTNPSNSSNAPNGHFGPNFLFNLANQVPEPVSLMLAGLALAALAATRRKPSRIR